MYLLIDVNDKIFKTRKLTKEIQGLFGVTIKHVIDITNSDVPKFVKITGEWRDVITGI